MEDRTKHLSPDRIRQFAEGTLILQPGELTHFQACDECSDAWWKWKQQFRHGKRDGDLAEEKSA